MYSLEGKNSFVIVKLLLPDEHPFTGTIEYAYDALDRRISKELNPGDVARLK